MKKPNKHQKIQKIDEIANFGWKHLPHMCGCKVFLLSKIEMNVGKCGSTIIPFVANLAFLQK